MARGAKYDPRLHDRARRRDEVGPRTVARNPFGGRRVICEDRALLVEEAPEAYKPIAGVIADLEAFGLVRVVASFRPLVTLKKVVEQHGEGLAMIRLLFTTGQGRRRNAASPSPMRACADSNRRRRRRAAAATFAQERADAHGPRAAIVLLSGDAAALAARWTGGITCGGAGAPAAAASCAQKLVRRRLRTGAGDLAAGRSDPAIVAL